MAAAGDAKPGDRQGEVGGGQLCNSSLHQKARHEALGSHNDNSEAAFQKVGSGCFQKKRTQELLTRRVERGREPRVGAEDMTEDIVRPFGDLRLGVGVNR